jgi:hypothetical protein
MKTSRTLLAALLLSIGGGAGAYAALDAPIIEPLEVMQNVAAAGDPSAQYNLALAYQEGRGVGKDMTRAVGWYRKAAAAGFGPAQFNLAVLLTNGGEVPKDDKEAAKWFYASAQSGNFDAQKALVKSYVIGRGVEKSPAKALAWDMIARRTLTLRFGADTGLPPKPGAVRADGAAEVAGKDGRKEWILPDGSRERMDESGVRHREHKDGSKTTVQTDGSWETVYPGGLTEQVTAQGRRTLKDAKGQMEISEPDGTRIEDGAGTNAQGEQVRIRDTFGLDGKRISRRVTGPDSTYEERADGTNFVETKVSREDGVECVLRQDVAADGTLGKGKLTRVDSGAGPKDTEIWAIRRILRLRDGVSVQVLEKYSEAGFYSQEVVKQVASAAPPSRGVPTAPGTASIPGSTQVAKSEPAVAPMTPPNAPTRVSISVPDPGVTKTIGGPVMGMGTPAGSGIDDPTAFAPKIDIQPMLQELEQIESVARNFAGATEAEYQRAQAAAAAYIIPLAVPPQKAGSTPAWLREKTITTTTLHELNLTPILDDRSKQYPFGPNGAEIIKTAAWKHAESDHFIVHYQGEAEARLTMQFIEGAYTVLTQLMNLDPARGPAKSHVFVFPEGEWKAYLRTKGHPPQLAGFAYKTELLLGAAANKEERAESIKVLSHEVTHALVSRFYPGQRLPLWLNEGLAEYIALRTMRAKNVALTPGSGSSASSSRSRGEQLTTQAPLLGKPDATIDVERLFTRIRYGTQTTPDRMEAFYANSQKCVQTLFEKLPLENFPAFFNAIAAGNRPEPAFANAYGKQCDGVAAFKRLVNGQ